ncbi:MAG TPA: tyrosine-protein phosphatase [Steroidobacteraceae bacterium]|nr:tyrosine-protein phosphatase [Steroidobacteraceae bacterium]
MSASCCSGSLAKPTSGAVNSNRLLTLDGGCNFRDIGGYSGLEGRTVRWGKVYRAGVLSYFKDSDHPRLHGLKVRAICDLRRAEERAKEPTRWPDANTQPLFFDDGNNMPTIRAFAALRPQTAAGMFDAMIDLYRALPEWMSGRLRGMFQGIAEEQVPMVVHCAAGKDRTGIAIGLLLAALGVERATIIEDYLLTNASDFEAFVRRQHDAQLGLADERHPLLAMPAEMRQVLLSAQPEFLEAAFEQVDRLGGLARFLRDICHVSDGTLESVKQTLLS